MVFFLIGCAGNPSTTPSLETPSQLSGKALFKSKACYSCHTIGHGPISGPDLRGLFSRRSDAWVKEYIADPLGMTARDPIARELKERYKIQMPKANLTPTELDDLLNYLKVATP